MRRQKISQNKHRVYMKKRIAKTRSRAQNAGFFYLLGTLAVTALACLPLLASEVAVLGAMNFWTILNVEGGLFTLPFRQVVIAGLYAIMLVVLLINVIRIFTKLGWLYKKKASKMYGFNRNVYAMDDMGKIFACSFSTVVVMHFAIYIACGEYAVTISPLAYAVIGAGLFFHFVACLIGSKVSLFDIEEGFGVSEQRRMVPVFPAFIRNVLQVAVIAVIVYMFASASNMMETFAAITPIVDNAFSTTNLMNYINGLAANPLSVVEFATQALTFVWIVVLVKHAVAATEYNMEGADGAGMKTSRVFFFLTFLTAAGTFVYRYVLAAEPAMDMNSLIVAAAALVMFIIEVIMRNAPGIPVEISEEDILAAEMAREAASDDVDMDYYFQGAYVPVYNHSVQTRPCYEELMDD